MNNQHASINRLYRLVWDEARGTWIAVHELARGRGKRSVAALRLLPALLALGFAPAQAQLQGQTPSPTTLPSGGQVVAGQAQISQSGAVMDVRQSSPRAAIDWQSFNLGSSAQINFKQPDAASVTLNRVLDGNASQIFGRISSNGQVFLSNPAGIYFSPTASADVGALTATTHGISTADFMAGKTLFERQGASGSVVNEGSLQAHLGGYIALLAPEVRNSGVLLAQAGTVALAAGEAIELLFDGGSLARLRVTPSQIAALVDNRQAVLAPDGLILLSARAAQELQGGVIRHSGSLAANSLTAKGGRIVLEADQISLASGSTITATGASGGGEVRVGGDWQGSGDLYQATRVTQAAGASIDTSATARGDGGSIVLWSALDKPASLTQAYGSLLAQGALGGKGGRIETSGHAIDVSGAQVGAAGGLWLLDPYNVTISTSATSNNSGYTPTGSGSNIQVSSINTALNAGTNVTVTTGSSGSENGDITVNAAISKTSGGNATLTLQAAGAIIMNSGSSISASSGSLNTVLQADSDASGSGHIWFKSSSGVGASITSNGGAITLSGGSDISTGYASGTNGANGNGITLDAATLSSGGGNIVIRGRSSTTGTSFSSSDGSSSNTDGVRLHGSNLIDAGSGTIAITGVARGTSSSSNGIETSQTGYTRILSSASNSTAISFLGDATAGTSSDGWGTFLWGTNSSGILLAATGSGGGVTLNGSGRNTNNGGGTHLEPNAFVLASSGPISLSGTKGAASSYADVVINSTVGFISALPAGFGIASPVTASSSDITLAADRVNANQVFGGATFANSAVQSTGVLTLKPLTTGKALTVQTSNPGGTAAWFNPNSMFGASGLFKTGFSKLVFGSASTGTVTLDNFTFDNDTEIRSGSAVVLGAVSIATKTLTVATTGSGSITDTGTVAVSKLQLDGSGSAVTLDSSGNAIGTVAANVASLTLRNASALTLGTVGSMNGISASGSIDVATLSGDLSVTQALSTSNTGSSALRLNAGQSSAARTASGGNLLFSGSGGVSVGSGGRATLFTGSVAGSTGLAALIGSGNFRYGSDESASNYSAALGSGLQAIYREAPTITVTAAGANKSYDKIAFSGGNGASIGSGGFANGDSAAILAGTLSYSGSAQGAINAGSYLLTPGGYSNSLGYTISYVSGTLVIAPRVLSISGSRVYNGSSGIAASALSFGNLLSGDSLSLSGSGSLASKNVGSQSLAGTGSLALAGSAAGNYTLSGATGAVTITPAELQITGVSSANKVYDGNTSVNLQGTATVVALGSDVVTLGGTLSGSFADKNVGTAKPISLSGYTLGGADGGNYTLGPLTANISPRALTVSYTGSNKVYDGSRAASVSASDDRVTGDQLSLAYSASFADKNAGNGKAIAITAVGLSGTDSGNYTVASSGSSTANISPASIQAITGITAANKGYDGGTAATLNTAAAQFSGLLTGDTLTVATANGQFSDKQAALGKTVSISGLSLGGAAAGNYQLLTTTASTTADISKATISAVTGITAANKVYDGTTAAALSTANAGFSGMVAGDALTVSATGTFTDKNAAVGKTVNISGLNLGGADAGNYQLTAASASTTADISKATLSAITGITAANKVYDGSTAATLATTNAVFNGRVAGDALTVASATGQFSDKNAASGKTVSINGLSLGGSDAGNYQLASNTASAVADITRATISAVTGISAANKVYDGTTVATLSTANAGFSGMLTGDALAVASATGTFADKNAATGKTVNISGLSLGGADAGNYQLGSSAASAVADITQATISAVTGITAANKGYDGTTAATLSTANAVFSGMLTGDALAVASATGTFADKNAAAGKTVAITGLSLGGADAANYQLGSTTASTVADISKATITAVTGITAANKVYDGSTSATLNTATAGFTGLIVGDALTVATATGQFSDKNAASGKAVAITSVSLSGADAGNYQLAESIASNAANNTANTTADITKATLSAVTGITAANKVYDGTTAATLVTRNAGFTGQVEGDTLAVATATGSFADKNAATGKAVAITGISLGGTDAGNYQLASTTASATADIAKAAIQAVTGITADNRPEDGTTLATLQLGQAGFVGKLGQDQLTVAQASGRFENATPGVQKTVLISGLSLGGSDAGNYLLLDTTATSRADITANAGTSPPPVQPVVPPVLPPVLPVIVPTLPTPATSSSVAGVPAPGVLFDGASVAAGGVAAAPRPALTPTTAGISVQLLRAPLAGVNGAVEVSVPSSIVSRGGFSFALPSAVQQVIDQAGSGGSVSASDAKGEPLPSWLQFDGKTRNFIFGSVPAGALPFEVQLTVNGQTTVIMIAERGE